MFDGADATAGSGDIGLAEVERRATLAQGAGRVDVQTQFDWAETMLSSGDRTSARLLIESAAIRQGFSPQLARSRAGLFAAVGIEQDAPATRRASTGNTVDIAIDELRSFAQAHGELVGADAGDTRREDGKPGLHPTARRARGALLPSGRGVADLIGHAFAALCPASAAPDDEAGAAAIEALMGSEREPSRWTAAGLAGAASPVLAGAIAVQELRGFLRASSDLLLPPTGSLALFRATAAFDSAGLGPYFGNVGQIIRSSTNLFELAAIAAEATGSADDPIVEEAWLVLLTRGLSGWLLLDVIDELGDRNSHWALAGILRRVVAATADEIDRSVVARIRDAALDNLDYRLAGSAQQAMMTLDPGNMLERRILGTIQASGGRIAAADQLLSVCLDNDPGDERLRQEVLANRERRYAPFALEKGFGSPRDRQLYRLHARRRRA